MNKTGYPQHKSRERGRPREFDMELALDMAMIVFRQKGFHASSIADLGEAMGLTAGSIYKAFQDKRTLFLRVFERYTALRHAELKQRLEPFPTGREQLAELLRFYIDSASTLEGRRGCLVVGSMNELRILDPDVSELVLQAVMRNKQNLISLLRLGQDDGSVSASLNVETAAGVLLCLVFGMRVVGKVEDVTEKEETIRLALKLLD
ncbi:TetR/AcrR family transcriptional regulator [Pantoea sp. FN060301]|uniref:TetR/AcrR family transcriptional regulator n=1 Tax=Pantoea sp. FN060301 TaxID=3420380 RepID=UPI003D16E752